ncbi:hypothetical protein [Sphingopyxis macrogoltabida]|uniref:Uncharacterized protein n=1 Tax=Sphingopyxis macrogoltabida TaxID=33050 RepID=A0AAC9FFB0_SPHMC|nr:hypothetical protein [Sphingopyxis macrogoltabida]ALJ13722.1 hypothetical protein LH19_12650 [Sphingopyxis macrogoltabida]AMU88835.1 hypothetical protein ATM17_07240 [Sphingopyxis macrogoltabida]
MTARSQTIEQERASLLSRFRRDPAGLVYSRVPGGEGRLVSEDEATALLVEFELMAGRHGRRFSHTVWAAVLGVPLFAILAATLNPLFSLLAIPALVGWFFVAVVQRLKRARFVAGIWAGLDRNPPVRALSRAEKLARGFALPWSQTALIFGVIIPLAFFIKIPASALPRPWGDWQMAAIALLFAVAIAMLVGRGIWLWRRRIAGRTSGGR